MPTEEKSCRNCGFNSSSDNHVHMCHDPKPCVDKSDWLPKGSIDVEIRLNKARKVEMEMELNRVNEYLGKIDNVLSDEQPKIPNQIREDLGMKPVIKDSGERTDFGTGAVRDMHEGKGRCDLLPPNALLRLARHFETGSLKYGDRNWELGIPCHSFADSGMRHLLKFMAGDTDEDHLIAAIWNLMCLAETEMLRPEMQDIPSRVRNAVVRGEDYDGEK